MRSLDPDERRCRNHRILRSAFLYPRDSTTTLVFESMPPVDPDGGRGVVLHPT
jgi:hypothetical protein